METPIRTRIIEDILSIIDEDIEHAEAFVNDNYLSAEVRHDWMIRCATLTETRERILGDRGYK